jgi:hypothetical protein
MQSRPVDESLILQAATAALMSKEVTSAEAGAFVNHIFRQAVAVNNRVLDIEKLTARRQTKYGVRVEGGFFPFSKSNYDLADPVQAQAAIQSFAVNKLRSTTFPGTLRSLAPFIADAAYVPEVGGTDLAKMYVESYNRTREK